MNALRVIHPYRYEGMWVFDDARVELVQEPFVSGADTVIDRMVVAIPGAAYGFTLIFSDKPFPGHQIALDGWLCPALFKYFDSAPARIFAQFKQKAG
jgi:hypothetical protein